MSKSLVSRFNRTWFSNYEPNLAFTVQCPVCEGHQPVELTWAEVAPGFGGNDTVARNSAPFLIGAHLSTACTGCGTPLTIYLAGAAGGRHGEVQYGVAGLRHAETTLV